jgi:hypothetical protein
MEIRYRKYLIVAAMVLASTSVGCGGRKLPTYPARGKVVFADGTPLAGGTVEFCPVESEKAVTARGQIQLDGSFGLGTFQLDDGAIEGEHRVLVCPAPPKRFGLASDPKLALDLRFTQFDTSGLKFTVTRDPGRNRFILQVDHPAGRK